MQEQQKPAKKKFVYSSCESTSDEDFSKIEKQEEVN